MSWGWRRWWQWSIHHASSDDIISFFLENFNFFTQLNDDMVRIYAAKRYSVHKVVWRNGENEFGEYHTNTRTTRLTLRESVLFHGIIVVHNNNSTGVSNLIAAAVHDDFPHEHVVAFEVNHGPHKLLNHVGCHAENLSDGYSRRRRRQRCRYREVECDQE